MKHLLLYSKSSKVTWHVLRRCYIDLEDIILNIETEMCDETLEILHGVFLKAEAIY